jgi:hypothetical protein
MTEGGVEHEIRGPTVGIVGTRCKEALQQSRCPAAIEVHISSRDSNMRMLR